MKKPNPLVIDLDGTLVKTDTLWESIFLLIKRYPFALMLLPYWALNGKVNLKQKVADRVQIDVTTLPYSQSVIDLASSASGVRPVILASASDSRVVRRIAAHLGLFDAVIGTEEKNQSGANKLEAIRREIGIAPFDYVGNSRSDVPIWNEARKAYVIGPSSLAHMISPDVDVERLPDQRPPIIRTIINTLRLRQWAKNLLLFAPLLLAHEITDLSRLLTLIYAFIAMSLCASGCYVVNDLLDLEADRRHPQKRNRPLASGAIPVTFGVSLTPILFCAAAAISAAAVSMAYLAILSCYVLVTFAYSLKLKQLLVVDVITLAGLYTLRLFSGSIAANVPISMWMLTFSSFFFLSLAFVKRYVELVHHADQASGKLPGRNYEFEDQNVVLGAGLGSGYVSILVLLLYVANSPESNTLYKTPQLLWALGPLLTYWLTRVWLLARRGLVDSDPVLFALRDRTSWIVGMLAGAVILTAASV
jgi:4-hydroxybenzoate polyprenyltransferase/phosphoserine phosphatase